MDEAEYMAILRSEFNAEEKSFLSRLRTELTWDKSAFSRLISAMEHCACTLAQTSELPRWLAEGFWFIDGFVPRWIAHPNFPAEHTPEYYAAACERLHDLAYWFFFGQSPSKVPLGPL